MAERYCWSCQAAVNPHDKFCMACGAKLDPPTDEGKDNHELSANPRVVESSDERAIDAGTPALEVSFGHTVSVGAPGVLTCRLTNPAGTPMNGELEVVAPALSLNQLCRFGLAAQEHAEFEMEFLAGSLGTHLVEFRLVGAGTDELRGRVAVDVARNEGPTVINVTDARRKDAKFIIGEESHLHLNVDGSSFDRSPVASAEFVPVPWFRPGDTRVTLEAAAVKHLFRTADGTDVFPANRICLRVRSQGIVRNICLLAASSSTLGKQIGNDIVLRVLPSSPENDELWMRVSRNHAEVEFTSEGAVWRNLQCTNGTVVDREVLAAGESAPLSTGTHLRPANAVELATRLFRDDILAGQLDCYRRLFPEVGEGGVGPLSAIRFSRVDNLADEEEYTLMQRSIMIGSDVDCPITIEGTGVAGNHALLHCFGGGFCLEPTRSGATTRLGPKPVPEDHLVPLRPGQTLHLGEVEVIVSPYRQLYVED